MAAGLKKLGIDTGEPAAGGSAKDVKDRGGVPTSPNRSWRKPEIHRFSLTKQEYMRTESDLYDQFGKQAGTRAYIRPADIMQHVCE